MPCVIPVIIWVSMWSRILATVLFILSIKKAIDIVTQINGHIMLMIKKKEMSRDTG